MNMRIELKTVVGIACITHEDGQRVYELTKAALAKGDSVILDFEEVRVYASLFFNAAAGQLLADFAPALLNERLSFEHLPENGRSVLARSIEASREFFASEPMRRAQEEAIRNISKAC